MNFKNLNRRLNRNLRSISNVKKNFIRTVAIFAAALSMLFLINQCIETNRMLGSDEYSLWGITIDHSSFWTRLRITGALMINLIAIWPYKTKGFWVSGASQCWVGGECLIWYLMSIKLKLDAGIANLPEPNTLGFFKASLWDITIFTANGVLLLWTLRTLVTLFASSSKELSNNQPESQQI